MIRWVIRWRGTCMTKSREGQKGKEGQQGTPMIFSRTIPKVSADQGLEPVISHNLRKSTRDNNKERVRNNRISVGHSSKWTRRPENKDNAKETITTKSLRSKAKTVLKPQIKSLDLTKPSQARAVLPKKTAGMILQEENSHLPSHSKRNNSNQRTRERTLSLKNIRGNNNARPVCRSREPKPKTILESSWSSSSW